MGIEIKKGNIFKDMKLIQEVGDKYPNYILKTKATNISNGERYLEVLYTDIRGLTGENQEIENYIKKVADAYKIKIYSLYDHCGDIELNWHHIFKYKNLYNLIRGITGCDTILKGSNDFNNSNLAGQEDSLYEIQTEDFCVLNINTTDKLLQEVATELKNVLFKLYGSLFLYQVTISGDNEITIRKGVL